jgi:hypothetical protein
MVPQEIDASCAAHLAMTAYMFIMLRRPSWVPARLEIVCMAAFTCLHICTTDACPLPVFFAIMNVAISLHGCNLDRKDIPCNMRAHVSLRTYALAATAAWVFVRWLARPTPTPQPPPPVAQVAAPPPPVAQVAAQPPPPTVPQVAAPPPPPNVVQVATPPPVAHVASGANYGRFDNCRVDTAICAQSVTITGGRECRMVVDVPDLPRTVASYESAPRL